METKTITINGLPCNTFYLCGMTWYLWSDIRTILCFSKTSPFKAVVGGYNMLDMYADNTLRADFGLKPLYLSDVLLRAVVSRLLTSSISIDRKIAAEKMMNSFFNSDVSKALISGIPGSCVKKEPKKLDPKLAANLIEKGGVVVTKKAVSTLKPKGRKPINPTKLFLNMMELLITNLMIKNRNFTNGHYIRNNGVHDLISDVRNSGQHLLNKMDEMRHLVELTDEELQTLEEASHEL